jgi:hypothetical protein
MFLNTPWAFQAAQSRGDVRSGLAQTQFVSTVANIGTEVLLGVLLGMGGGTHGVLLGLEIDPHATKVSSAAMLAVQSLNRIGGLNASDHLKASLCLS